MFNVGLVSDDKHFENQTRKLPSAFLEDLKVCVKITLLNITLSLIFALK